jgi:hypothetical protein
VDAIPTSAIIAVQKNAVTVLSAASVALNTISVANVGEAQTLATPVGVKRVAKGDVLLATTTVTTAGSMTVAACTVEIAWDTW